MNERERKRERGREREREREGEEIEKHKIVFIHPKRLPQSHSPSVNKPNMTITRYTKPLNIVLQDQTILPYAQRSLCLKQAH